MILDIGPIDAIPLPGARKVVTPKGCVAVFRTGPSEAFATANACPHKGGPLAEGIVHGAKVTCPLHNNVVDLATGASDEGRVATYPVEVRNGRILLDVSALVAVAAE